MTDLVFNVIQPLGIYLYYTSLLDIYQCAIFEIPVGSVFRGGSVCTDESLNKKNLILVVILI